MQVHSQVYVFSEVCMADTPVVARPLNEVVAAFLSKFPKSVSADGSLSAPSIAQWEALSGVLDGIVLSDDMNVRKEQELTIMAQTRKILGHQVLEKFLNFHSTATKSPWLAQD